MGDIGFVSGLLSMLASVAVAAVVDRFFSPRLYAVAYHRDEGRSFRAFGRVAFLQEGGSENNSAVSGHDAQSFAAGLYAPLAEGGRVPRSSGSKEDGYESETADAAVVGCSGFKILVVAQLGLTALSFFALYIVVASLAVPNMHGGAFASILPSLSRSGRMAAIWILLCASSVFQAGISPMLYELAAECTFPLDPSVSLAVIVLVYNISTLVVLGITPALQGEAQSIIPITVGTMSLCFALSILIKTDFKRSLAEHVGSANFVDGERRLLLPNGEGEYDA